MSFPIQTSNLNGKPKRLIGIGERYGVHSESSTLVLEKIVTYSESVVSQPLSKIEIVDIEASEREFLSRQAEIYDNAEDLITALHAERRRFQEENRE